MAEMKAMEFTDELNLQPVRRPVPEPQAGEILIQVSAAGVAPTEKLLVYHPPLCGRHSPIQGDSQT
jgi:NADPH:quinone reductase-like Zn-dependent oxidoreductase